MFKNNILILNPGWDEIGTPINSLDDIGKLQKHLKNKRVKFESEADKNSSGTASFVVTHTDGNNILDDQQI